MKMISLVFRDDSVTVGLSLASGIAASPVDAVQLWNTSNSDLFRFIRRWADETLADTWELFLVDLNFIQFLRRRIQAETGRPPEVILEERENALITSLNGWDTGQVVIGIRKLSAANHSDKRTCLEAWRKICSDEGLPLIVRIKKDLSGAATFFLAQHGIPASRLAVLTVLVFAQADPTNDSLGLHTILSEIGRLYGVRYAENTRESLRRDVIAPMLQAGLLLLNPDEPGLPKSHPRTHYALTQAAYDELCTGISTIRRFYVYSGI